MDKSKSVLIVDDMPSMRKVIARALKTQFEFLIEASDGFEAFRLLKSANPPVGLIISDWNMPSCTGIDFLKLVRASDEFSKVPFMMVTSEAEKSLIVEAINEGATGYVVKPFTPEVLLARVHGVLQKEKS